MRNFKAIELIVKKHLCTGCGSCVGICFQNAIVLHYNSWKGIYIPKIKQDSCNNCGNCHVVCPGYPFTYKNINFSNKGELKSNPFLGAFNSCYIGYSLNDDIRYRSASGGLITQLLIFALEKGLIDAAIVTSFNKENSFKPKAILAESREQIIKASQSKYCPVPVNLIIKEVFKRKDLHDIAFVGLPCQIEGIRLAERKFELLRKKIKYHFGLFCSHELNFHATNFLLKNLGIRMEEIKKVNYRGYGWPGKIIIEFKNGELKYIKSNHPLWEKVFHCGLFTPIRCVLCNDLSSELADLSFGDAWLPEIIKEDNIGTSIVISRTDLGENLLKMGVMEKKINIKEISHKKVFQSQKGYSYIKKVNIYSRLKLHGLFFKTKYPDKQISASQTIYDKYLAFILLFSSYIGNKLGYLTNFLSYKIIGKVYSKFLSNLLKSSKQIRIKKALNVLILHAHWNNRGDESAIRAMIDSLKQELPINQMKIMIMVEDVKYFPHEDIQIINQYPLIKRPYSFIDIILLFLTKGRYDFPTLMDVLLMIFSKGSRAFSREGKQFLKHVSEADIIIHAPGGPMFGEHYVKYEFPYLLRIFIPIFKKKPVFFYAPSIGPFNRKVRNIFRKFILKRVHLITLRDQESARYLKEQLHIDSIVTIDSALQNKIFPELIRNNKKLSSILNLIETQKVIGITMTELRWHPKYKDNLMLRKRIHESIAKFTNYLIQKGFHILIIPQIFEYTFEKAFLEKIHRLNEEKIHLLPEEIDSYTQQAIISKLYCVVGMRYHPNIFAAKMSIPSIAICYEHKATSFMEKLGRSDLIINVMELNVKNLIDKFIYLEENYEKIKKEIKARITQCTKISQKTTKIIKMELKRMGLI
ncbi:MAG: Coenzyme F420 hydrogenase/dehydrogenase, beta subunit C-terminal domain [Promethearchaeota archaeon]